MRNLAANAVVFGSGFAAREVVRELARAGRSILVVERGQRDLATADPELSRVAFRREPVQSGGFDFGAQVPASFDRIPRYIGLGGTAELWSGKWRALDDLDFRREINGRRWPFGRGDLDASLQSVARAYGVPSRQDDPGVSELRQKTEAEGLRLLDIYEERPPARLRDEWLELERSGDVTVLDSTSLVGVRRESQDSLVEAVQVETPAGTRLIESSHFIVACGGIESVLMSRQFATHSGGRESRRFAGYMDHPKGLVGRLTAERNRELLRHLVTQRAAHGRLLAFGLPEAELERDAMGNHTLFLWPVGHEGEGADWQLVINLEQFPEEENFIVTGDRTEVSWRISRSTWWDMSMFLDRVGTRLGHLIGSVQIESYIQLRGASHPAGCLPFGSGATNLIDSDMRLRAASNVYCVSSALFPLSGSANPTMTIAALGHRLGAQLAE